MSGLALTSNDLTLTGRRVIGSLMRGGIKVPPAITNEGAAGAVTYGYKIEAVTEDGEVPLSPEGETTTGNATLDGANFNRLTWPPFLGAISYNIYRTNASAGTPNTTGLIGNVTGTQFDDQGAASTASVPSRQFGISHVAIGRFTTVANPFALQNRRVGNNYQMDTVFSGPNIVSVAVHNDFVCFNYTANGVPNVWYFTTVANTQQDTTLDFASIPALQQNKFNHIFMIADGFTGVLGIGQLVIEATDTPEIPVRGDAIVYLGHIETGTQIRNVVTACRMFDEIDRVTPDSIDFLDDSALTIASLGPNANVTGGRTSNLLVTARFGPGIIDTAREIALFANDGRDLVAWQELAATPITVGQRFRVQWRIAF